MFPRHGLADTINFAVGIPLNVFLLYLIRRFSRKELGAYKHLLTIFAAHDILLALVEALCCGTAVRLGSTFISVVCRTFWESRHLACAYVTLYTIPFILTNLNFLYRYWAIKSPDRLELYSRKTFQGTVILCIAASCAGWYFALYVFCGGRPNEPDTIKVREWYAAHFNTTINDGWIVLEYWPDGHFALRPFFVLIFTDTMLLIQILTALFLSTMTFYHIHNNTAMSESSRNAQQRVLVALCAQTIVPFFCVYTPYLSTINTPFLGIPSFISPETTATFVSAFPLWDATVIILMMKDYRDGARSLIVGSEKMIIGAASTMFTSSVSHVFSSSVSVAPMT